MKSYPTIPKQVQTSEPIYAFDKLDGSNIRAEWSKKRGFYKYGTRTRLLSPSERPLGIAVELINDLYGNELAKRLKSSKTEKAVCFFEFFGKNSFAGFHEEKDEFNVILLDVSLFRHGFFAPRPFLRFAEGLTIPNMVYHGKANQPFVNSIREGICDGVTYEGVVCKYSAKNRIYMFKIKSHAWLDRLKQKCSGDDKLFERLA